jgi:ATP-binding protein involved in chromosome partitioning
MVTETEVRHALAEVTDPELRRNIVELGMVRDLRVTEGKVSFALALTTLACPLKDQIERNARLAVLALPGIESADIRLDEMTASEKAKLQDGEQREGLAEKLNHAKHGVAVMSSKGGVGKSLVAGLLAVSLRRSGYQVGVLDADITGPGIPKMLFPNGARPGASHAEEMARQLTAPFLGRLPIDPRVATLCDAGQVELYDGEVFRPVVKRIVELAAAARPPVMKGT